MNADIKIEIPRRIAKLPLDERGYPIPFFVAYGDDGKPDFRAMDADKWGRAVRDKLCWVCGEKLGRYKAFTLGPMCAINRTSGEPPSHRECAEFSARACPFLTNPSQKRNRKSFKGDVSPPGGEMISRNPGCVLVWVTESYTIINSETGPVVKIGEPSEITLWCEGRPAFRHEVVESIESGFPLLYDMAEKEGGKAIDALCLAKKRAYEVLFNGDEKAA
jgi:hypothetical protein